MSCIKMLFQTKSQTFYFILTLAHWRRSTYPKPTEPLKATNTRVPRSPVTSDAAAATTTRRIAPWGGEDQHAGAAMLECCDLAQIVGRG